MRTPFSRTYSIPVDREHGYGRIVIELSVPTVPAVGSGIKFAEHVQRGGVPTDTIVATARGHILVSDDLGSSWEALRLANLDGVDIWNSFTTANGFHLIQGEAAASSRVPRGEGRPDGPIAVLDDEWNVIDTVTPGLAVWHGSRSIDEANGVIVYGEYPSNAGRFAPGFDLQDPTPRQRELLHDSRLLRSIDGGRTWEVVLLVDWRTIRHFHTVVADPALNGRWWASSGDRPSECRVWQSLDDGETWKEMQIELPREQLHPRHERHAQHVLRYTDMIVRDDDLIWGCDDLLGAGSPSKPDIPLGRRAGSRVFRTPKDAPWRPESIAYVGQPIRSIIDVGQGYLLTTEAKGPLGYCPTVALLSKSEPFELTPLMTIDNFARQPLTGFTHSRSSRTAKDGVFFTYRRSTDAFPTGAQILRWRIAFD